MMSDRDSKAPMQRYRVTAAQRDQIIERLSDGYAHGLLEEEEFERRVNETQTVATQDELLALVADLPAVDEHPQSGLHAAGIRISPHEIRPYESFLAILGGSDRKGPWRPARRSRAVAVLGGVDLDFRDAIMAPGVTEIKVVCVLGGVDIIVPAGMNVEANGIAILGGFDNRAGSGDPGAPTIRVSGFAILGGVDIKVKRATS